MVVLLACTAPAWNLYAASDAAATLMIAQLGLGVLAPEYMPVSEVADDSSSPADLGADVDQEDPGIHGSGSGSAADPVADVDQEESRAGEAPPPRPETRRFRRRAQDDEDDRSRKVVNHLLAGLIGGQDRSDDNL